MAINQGNNRSPGVNENPKRDSRNEIQNRAPRNLVLISGFKKLDMNAKSAK